MPTFPEQGGSNNTWGTELRDFFSPFFNLASGEPNADALVPADSLTGDKIKDGAIVASKIATGAVEESKIATGAVTLDKIGTNAINESKIGVGAVTENKIYDGAITTNKIANSAVTADKLAPGAITSNIPDGSITNAKLATDAVTADKILDATITSAKLASGAAIANIASGSITTEKLATGAVDSGAIANLAITTDKIFDGAVNNNKILNGTIGPEKLSFVVDVSGGNNGLVTIISGTYDGLVSAIGGGTLTPGQLYSINDFRTRHIIPNTTDYNGDISLGDLYDVETEVLIVEAVTNSTISPIAKSELYPNDIIYYTTDNANGSDRGHIYYREDPVNKVKCWEDWRHLIFRRWERANINDFTSITDTASGYQDFTMFAGQPTFVEIGRNGTSLSNNVFKDSVTVLKASDYFKNNTFESTVEESNFGLYIENSIFYGAIWGNNVSDGFNDNIFYGQFYGNTITGNRDDSFSGNIFNGDFILNICYLITNCTFGSNVNNNTFKSLDGVSIPDNTNNITYDRGLSVVGPVTIPTLNITGLTTIELSGAQWSDVIKLTSSNTTETVDSILNPFDWTFELRPETGLVVTLTASTTPLSADGQIALFSPYITLDGDKGERIKLKKLPGLFGVYQE